MTTQEILQVAQGAKLPLALADADTKNAALEAMAVAPRRIFSLGGGTIAAGEPADLTAVDTERAGTVDPDRFLSMGRSTPFAGMAVRGEVMLTLVGGREAYRNGDLKR